MLTNREAADWRRCEGTVSAVDSGAGPQIAGLAPVRAEARPSSRRPGPGESREHIHMYDQSNMISPWPAFASLRSEWSRAHRAGRGPGPEERPGSWDFFSSALQGAFDAAGMDHEVEVLSNQLRERGGSEQRVAKPVLEQEIDDEVGELVGVTGSGSLRDQARQAGAVVEHLGLIEDGTGEPERLSRPR